MAKNQVVLTFAGDSKSLERSFDKVGAGAEAMSRDVGRSSRDMGSALDRVGEAGGTAETRFLGLGAGISGVSTIMSGDAGPEDYAMALADLGDSIEHTVIPLIQGMGKKILTTGANAITSAGQHAVAAATTTAGWIKMGVTSTINAAKMAAAWLISLGPIALVIAGIAAVIAILVALGVDFDDLKNIAGAAWEFIKGAAMGVFNWLKSNWPLVLAILTGPIGLAVLGIVKHWDTIKNGFTTVKNWIRDRVNDIVSFITGIPGRIASAAKSIGSTIINGIKNGISSIGGFVGDIASSIKGAINDALHLPFTIKGPGPLPDFTIPAFHQGGIVPGAPGTETLALLQAGERVTRAGASGGGSIVIDMRGAIVADGRQFEQMVVRAVRSATGKGVPLTVKGRAL